MENPFTATATARRYALGRPYHHERTLRRALQGMTLQGGTAIDVACGTGLSTRAVRNLGFDVVGVEVVPAMAEIARTSTGLSFALAAAERLPVRSGVAALVTVGSAIHWFDQDAFQREAARVLRPNGLLLLYEHAAVHLPDDPSFLDWAHHVYMARYPTPPRGATAGRRHDAMTLSEKIDEARWIDTVVFSHNGLVDYLMTQSNVVDAIESRRETPAAIREWLLDQTSRFYIAGSAARAFAFHASMELLRNT